MGCSGCMYNFCWRHQTLGEHTPATAAEITDHQWRVRQLFCYVMPCQHRFGNRLSGKGDPKRLSHVSVHLPCLSGSTALHFNTNCVTSTVIVSEVSWLLRSLNSCKREVSRSSCSFYFRPGFVSLSNIKSIISDDVSSITRVTFCDSGPPSN